MSLSRETMTELMAFADGELDGEARARVEKLAAESPEARRLVEAMRSPALGVWLAEGMDERTAAADGIADAVMAKIDAARKDAGIEGVVRLSAARSRRSSITRGQVAAMAGFLALAATIFLYMRNDREGTDLVAPVASAVIPTTIVPSADQPPVAATTAMAQAATPPQGQGVEVDEIDSPAHGVTVFEIPASGVAAAAGGGAPPPSVVIMIEDEPVPVKQP
jgi:anti-sigma factor RsiW